MPATITGWSAICPTGATPSDLWGAVLESRTSAVTEQWEYSDRTLPFVMARAPELEHRFERQELRRMGRVHQLGVAAALDALIDADLGDPTSGGLDPGRVAVVVGNGGGPLELMAGYHEATRTEPGRLNPLAMPLSMINSLAARIALTLGVHGPVHTIATACAGGADAVGYATMLLDAGRADRVIVVGAESGFTHVPMLMFRRMGALTERYDDPGSASRPFDSQRDGFVGGEGSAAFVLERPGDCPDRPGRAEVLGYAATNDAHHLAAPDPNAVQAEAAMRAAVADAGLTPADVMSVNAHGTSTPRNDEAEIAAITRVFGESIPVTATKSVTGHMIAASGAIEVVVAGRSASSGVVPPVASTNDPITANVVIGAPAEVSPGPVISNAFGFGGHNACLIIGPS